MHLSWLWLYTLIDLPPRRWFLTRTSSAITAHWTQYMFEHTRYVDTCNFLSQICFPIDRIFILKTDRLAVVSRNYLLSGRLSSFHLMDTDLKKGKEIVTLAYNTWIVLYKTPQWKAVIYWFIKCSGWLYGNESLYFHMTIVFYYYLNITGLTHYYSTAFLQRCSRKSQSTYQVRLG